MTKINNENINEYWQKFLDCCLSENEESELMAFIEANPELIAEIDETNNFGNTTYDKSTLSPENITENLLIKKIEGVISETDNAIIETEISDNSETQKTYEAYRKTISTPDLSICYPDKNKLLKRGIVVWLKPLSAVAAILIILIGIGFVIVRNIDADKNAKNEKVEIAKTGNIPDEITIENEKKIIPKTDSVNTNSVKEEIQKSASKAIIVKKINQENTEPKNDENLALNTATDSVIIIPETINSEIVEQNAETENIDSIVIENIDNHIVYNSKNDIETNEEIIEQTEEIENFIATNDNNSTNGITIVNDTKWRKKLRRTANQIGDGLKESGIVTKFIEIKDEITLAYINSKK